MISGSDLSSKFALDVQGVSQLKLEAKQSSPEKTRCTVRPSALIHFWGNPQVRPSPSGPIFPQSS